MTGEVLAVSELGDADRAAMCAVLDRHFVGVTREQFERDLADKHWAALMRDEHGVIRGFSTLAMIETSFEGQPLRALYSGDTIVDRDHWGSPVLVRTWLAFVRQLGQGSTVPLVWILICSGYRTYRILPVFFREFYPRHDRPTPARVQAMMHALAGERYGGAYQPGRGLVVLAHPTPLREELIPVSGTRQDAHVEHFFHLDPGHDRGDELVCFCPIADENFTAAGWRMVRAGLRASGERVAQR
jgi:hypothetical protein